MKEKKSDNAVTIFWVVVLAVGLWFANSFTRSGGNRVVRPESDYDQPSAAEAHWEYQQGEWKYLRHQEEQKAAREAEIRAIVRDELQQSDR
jgi:hypothetical protein